MTKHDVDPQRSETKNYDELAGAIETPPSSDQDTLFGAALLIGLGAALAKYKKR